MDDDNMDSKMEEESQKIPPLPGESVASESSMAGIFSGRAASRKGTSGSSSGSSENTPLLNGSQEGPCYAYSYGSREEDAVDSISTVVSCEENEEQKKQLRYCMNVLKRAILIGAMIFCVVALCFVRVQDGKWNAVAVTCGKPIYINITADPQYSRQVLRIKAKGPFLPGNYYGVTKDMVQFAAIKRHANGTTKRMTRKWTLFVSTENIENEEDFVNVEKEFTLEDSQSFDESIYQLVINSSKRDAYVTLSVNVTVKPEIAIDQIVIAIFLLIGLYVLLIFELVHRTLAAMIGACTAIACLALINNRPSLEELLVWIDVETLALLFGMMILISILSETGFLDFLSVAVYKLARGGTWPLLTGLFLTTALLSAFMDNLAAILLMTAVSVRFCEVMNIDPKNILVSLVVFSNIGSALTPIGNLPNSMIMADKEVHKSGIGYGNFTLHMLPAVILNFIVAFAILRVKFREASSMRFSEPAEVVEIKHEVAVWMKAYSSLSAYTKDEDNVRTVLIRKIATLETHLRKKLYDCKISENDFKSSLMELSNTFRVKNKPLLIKSGLVISIVLVLFFLESVPQINLSIGWIPILGAISLLVLADFEELESVFSRVEWSTLLFLASLLAFMQALSKLQLFFYIAQLMDDVIGSVDESQQLLLAIVLILWVSALASSFMNNVAVTAVMINAVTNLAENPETNLPLAPLVYALALGASIGGNGTLIGASANIVTAGVSEQHGYRFSFYEFFIIGFPVMLLTALITTAYLLVCHVALQWDN